MDRRSGILHSSSSILPTPERPLDGFRWAHWRLPMFMLVACAVCLIVLGVGIALGLAVVAASSALTGVWIVSSSTATGLVRGRWSSGFRAAVYQVALVLAVPSGVLLLFGLAMLFSTGWSLPFILGAGVGVGIAAGLAIAFLSDRVTVHAVRLARSRWESRGQPRRLASSDAACQTGTGPIDEWSSRAAGS